MGHDAGFDAYMTGAVALQMSVAAITVHKGQARAEVPDTQKWQRQRQRGNDKDRARVVDTQGQ